MKTIRKSAKLSGGLIGAALLLAACGGSSSSVTSDTAAGSGSTSGATAMTVAYKISSKAVWEDKTPITADDFKCTWEAQLNTPGSIGTSGYDKISSVEAGATPQDVVVKFKEIYAPWKGLFSGLIKKAAVANCNDISNDFQTSFNYSGTEWKLDSWSKDQAVFSPNANYWGPRKPGVSKLVMVPKPDTEIAALKAGEVDFIYPQFYAGITDELKDPKVKTVINYGGDYEGLYLNLGVDGKDANGNVRPFSDAAVREAFYKSIDLDALFKQIYIPIAPTGKLLTCGPIVPGNYCPSGVFGNKYDQKSADSIMTKAGYAKGSDGFWAKDGKTLDIKWMVNAGNKRREDTQAYLIPLLAKAGFKVTADNCDAACVFQKRLPAMDYDIAMYISTAPPDPAYLTPSFAGDEIPTEANGNTGQNFQGWNNATATKDLHDADKELNDSKRANLIKDAIKQMDKDYIFLPTFQFPKSAAYRTDLVSNVEGQLNNFAAFNDEYQWKDTNGDGQIVIGAEQWPDCLNPTTECANSSWYVWTIGNMLTPGVYRTTNDAKYELTELMDGTPKVTIGS